MRVTLDSNILHIGNHTISDCKKLFRIVPFIIKIVEMVFAGCPQVCIYGYKGSITEQYAKENNISFISIDNSEPERFNLQERTDCENIPDLEQNKLTNLGIEDKIEKVRKVSTTQ